MTIPTEPAAYWNPENSLTHVYYLRRNGEWFHGTYGVSIDESLLPVGLQLLGHYRDRDVEGE